MKTDTILLMAMLTLAPVALLAATNDARTTAPAAAKGAHGWFKQVDANGDGAITHEEALAAAHSHIEKEFATFDTNHDGQITQDEIKAVHAAKRAEVEAQFDARFKQADANGDGQLSKDEAQAATPFVARAFDRLDTNKDGELSLDEIKAGHAPMAQQHHSRRGPHGSGPPPADGSQPSESQDPALR
jgi:Ca2+-binding EF-hand superfamily protein